MKDKIIRISIEVGGGKFSLNCHPMLFDKYKVKRGRSWSNKVGLITMTGIFDLCRKWAVMKTKED